MFVDVVLPFSLQIEFDSWFLWKERAVAPGVFEIDEVLFKTFIGEFEWMLCFSGWAICDHVCDIIEVARPLKKYFLLKSLLEKEYTIHAT